MAAKWSDLSVLLDPDKDKNGVNTNYMDTKANLLYKIGEIKKAMAIEETAYKMEKAIRAKQGEKRRG